MTKTVIVTTNGEVYEVQDGYRWTNVRVGDFGVTMSNEDGSDVLSIPWHRISTVETTGLDDAHRPPHVHE